MQSDTEIQNDSPQDGNVPAADTSSTEATASESQGETKETLLDVVKDAVKAANGGDKEEAGSEDDEEEAPTSDAEGKDDAEQEGEEDEVDPEDAQMLEDAKAAGKRTQKEVRKLLRHRSALRKEVAALQPAAEIGTELNNFAKTHDLSGDDVINALHIAATLRRGDWSTFYQMVSPFVRRAQEEIGVVLPEDVQQMVDAGQISPQAAQQFVRTRFDQERLAIENRRNAELSQQYFTTQVQGNVSRAVSDYEAHLAARDPDYKAKAGFVERAVGDRLRLLQSQGRGVSSVNEAIEIVKDAYNEVNTQFRKFAQPPKATSRTPNGTNSQPPAAKPTPKNMMEAALAGLNSSRAG